MTKTNKIKLKDLLVLHFLFFMYSVGILCANIAARQPLLSLPFILLYGTLLLILFVYAIFWQQLLKRISLTTAFANRAAIIFWGMLWGRIFFEERVTPLMILAVAVIYIGVMIVVTDKQDAA